MNKSKQANIQGVTVLVWLLAIMLTASLFFGIFTFARVNRLHAFFNTFSDEYRSLSDNGNTAPAPELGNNPSPTPAAGDPAANCVDGDIDVSSDPFIGDANAPVTIVEYSDFECPFCARFITGAYPQIKSEYVDTGKVRLIFKDFPLENSHPLAVPAALTANCIQREFGNEAFFAFHDRLFIQQSALSQGNIENWAREAGLSDEQRNACFNDPAMLEEIYADRDEGVQLGINGTPSFVVNGELLVGAQPFEVFQLSIEKSLAGANSCVN